MIADGVPSGENILDNLGMFGRSSAHHKEGCSYIISGEEIQNNRRGARIRSIVKGEGDAALSVAGTANNRQKESKGGKEGSCAAEQQEKNEWDEGKIPGDKNKKAGGG